MKTQKLKINVQLKTTSALQKLILLYVNIGVKEFFKDKVLKRMQNIMMGDTTQPKNLVGKMEMTNKEITYKPFVISTRLSLPEKFFNRDTRLCEGPFEQYNVKVSELKKSIELLFNSMRENKPDDFISPEDFRDAINKYIFNDIKEKKDVTFKEKKATLYKEIKAISKKEKINVEAPVYFADFVQFRIDLIKRMPKGGKTPGDATLINYGKFRNKLVEYENEKKVKLNLVDINNDIVNDILQWFSDLPSINSVETVNSFKAQMILHLGKAQSKKYEMAKDIDLKDEFLIKASADKKDVYLTFSDLQKLKSLKFDTEEQDEKRLEKIRDLFVIGCNCGYAWTDLIGVYLQTDDDGEKYYFRTRRNKNQNMARIPVLDEWVIPIMKKYNNDFSIDYNFQKEFNRKLPILIMRAKINMKEEIGRTNHKSGEYNKTKEDLKDLVSSKSCRKTMASNAVRHYKKPLYIVQAWGAWESVDTLKSYISLSKEEIYELDREHSNMMDDFKKLKEENESLKKTFLRKVS